MISNWNEYLKILDYTLTGEPEWMAPSITKALSEVIINIDTSIKQLSNINQSNINRHIFNKAKKYNINMAQVSINEPDSYLFDESRLFPIHSLEWCLANLEFFTEHFYEMSWITKKAFSKILRVSTKRYGERTANEMISTAILWIKVKSNDWNRTLYELIDYIIDNYDWNIENEPNNITNAEILLGELISNSASHVWSSKDNINIKEHIFRIKDVNPYVKTAVMMFNILSDINVKTKRKKLHK